MTPERALRFLRAQAKEIGWGAVAAKMGESEAVVYAWHRRNKVPRWRLPKIVVLHVALAEQSPGRK